MKSVHAVILAALLILSGFSAGCIGDDTPAPVAVSAPQPGVLIQEIGNVTGQGVFLEGVPRGTIDTITFIIGLAPGEKSVDLNGTVIAYADSVRTEILTPVEDYRGNPPPGYWGIIDTINEVGSRNMRLDYEEQFIIRINPKAPVVPNQMITISVKPKGGKPLMIRRIAPSTVGENDNILAGV